MGKSDVVSSSEKEKKLEREINTEISPSGWGVRHTQAVLLFLCLLMAYALRVNMSVGIVAMTDRNNSNPDFEEFAWTEKTQGVVLSSFFWGYVITQIPAGQLAQKFGPKILLLISIGTCACGLLWSVLWFFYGGNSPAEYKNISLEEKEFIQSSLGSHDHKKIVTPWRAMLTSAPMIALIIVHSAHNWGFWTLLTEMPTYMKNVLGLDIKKNALLSALPYFCMWCASMVLSPLSDFLTNRGHLSLGFSRKLFNSIGLWGPMCALLGLAYVPKGSVELAVALLTVAVGINSATYLGFQVNHIDLAPNHAGTMMGITNCAANIMSFLAPLVVGFVLDDAKNPEQWKIVFFISAAIYFFGNLQFVIFGKATKQWWNSPKGKDVEEPQRRPSIAEAQY
uniref:CSON007770 protein n=1 Tax=Culicoides sonorensis TaxID=179676 RepID=A0A336M251_CULSO